MKKIIQLIGAVLVGLVVCLLITVQFEHLGAYWYPLPVLNPSPLEMAQYMADSPTQLHVLYVVGYGVSVWIGAYVAARFAPKPKQEMSVFIVSFCYLLGLIVFLISMPRPIWASLACVGAVLLSAFSLVLIFRKMIQ